MARRRSVHDVEVLEEDDPRLGEGGALDGDTPLDDAGAPPTRTPDAAALDRPRRRRAVTAAAVLLAVVLGAAATAQVLTGRRGSAPYDPLAHPGMVAPLDGPPRVWWTTQDADDVLRPARASDGVLVGVRHSTGGPVQVVGRDPRTGDVLWTSEPVDGTTRPPPDAAGEPEADFAACAGLPREQHRVVCLVPDGAWAASDRTPATVPTSGARVVVLDSRDGTVVTDLTMTPAPAPASQLSVWGDRVVVSPKGPTSSTDSVSATTVDGTSRWVMMSDAMDGGIVAATVLGDLLAVSARGEVRLLAPTFELVRTVEVPENWSSSSGLGQVVVQPLPPQDGPVAPSPALTTVLWREGVSEVLGEPLGTTFDDGSAPGLVLTTGPGRVVRAWGPGTQDLRWSTEATAPEHVLVLDGRVHLWSRGALTTLDASTGEAVWRSGTMTGPPLTDGQYLIGLASTAGHGAGRQVVAVDPSDGSEVWRAGVPDHTADLVVRHQLLVAVGEDPATGRMTATVLG